jgi:hypothetical protein
MDFTLTQYTHLLNTMLKAGSTFHTYESFLLNTQTPTQTPPPPAQTTNIILRHDVDLLPQNSLAFARIQASLGIKASYYFRIVPESFNEKIILEIASLGHEIGYHYETMDTEAQKLRKSQTQNPQLETLIDSAYETFCQNLSTFRSLVPVKTICMHGSPRSKYDNRDIWKKYSYRELNIIGEPYFDTDFSKIAYYTDTARMWDGSRFSVRDRIPSKSPDSSPLFPFSFFLFPSFHSTSQIISSLLNKTFPPNAMFTFHPQRWTNQPFPWLKELLMQNLKNLAKSWIVKNRPLSQVSNL